MFTIQYEFLCYMVVGAWGFLRLFRTPWLWLSALLGTALIGYTDVYKTYGHWHVHGVSWGARIMCPFFVGACYQLYQRFIPLKRTGVFAALLLLMASWPWINVFEPTMLLCFSYLLFYVMSLSMPWLRWMEHVPDISYGVYLYGWPVESLWIWYHRAGYPGTTFAVSLVLCTALGWLSWHFVERPFMRLKRRPSAPVVA